MRGDQRQCWLKSLVAKVAFCILPLDQFYFSFQTMHEQKTLVVTAVKVAHMEKCYLLVCSELRALALEKKGKMPGIFLVLVLFSERAFSLRVFRLFLSPWLDLIDFLGVSS